MITSERMSVSLHEIEAHWSIDDLLDANLALEVWEEVERKSAQELERRRG